MKQIIRQKLSITAIKITLILADNKAASRARSQPGAGGDPP